MPEATFTTPADSPAGQATAAVGGCVPQLGVPGPPPTGSGESITGDSSFSCSVLLMCQPGLATSGVETIMEDSGVSELYVDLSSTDSIEKAVDDTMWEQRFNALKTSMDEHCTTGGIFVHAGIGVNDRSREKQSRLAAALLLRMISIITLLPFRWQSIHVDHPLAEDGR